MKKRSKRLTIDDCTCERDAANALATPNKQHRTACPLYGKRISGKSGVASKEARHAAEARRARVVLHEANGVQGQARLEAAASKAGFEDGNALALHVVEGIEAGQKIFSSP